MRVRQGQAAFLTLLALAVPGRGQEPFPPEWFLNAHNSYPEGRVGVDRLQGARRLGLWAVELDVAWSDKRRRTVVTHDAKKLTGAEPTLEEYFFRPLAPELRRMPRGRPGLLLMMDLKSDHPGPVKEVHGLLRRHRELLTTSRPGAPIRWGPLTVILSENLAAIAMFEKLTPAGEPYLAMGVREPPERKFQQDIADYFPELATPFYRLFNFEWKHVEVESNPKAGEFTPAERGRLQALVKMAREKGYWVRAWTLNATATMWGTGRNFGSREAALARWRAALEAGVDCVATDEYEMAGEFLRGLK